MKFSPMRYDNADLLLNEMDKNDFPPGDQYYTEDQEENIIGAEAGNP